MNLTKRWIFYLEQSLTWVLVVSLMIQGGRAIAAWYESSAILFYSLFLN